MTWNYARIKMTAKELRKAGRDYQVTEALEAT